MKTLRLVLADVGFGATVFQDINDNVDALLALPPTKLSEIMNSICKGATAGAGQLPWAASAAATTAAEAATAACHAQAIQQQ